MWIFVINTIWAIWYRGCFITWKKLNESANSHYSNGILTAVVNSIICNIIIMSTILEPFWIYHADLWKSSILVNAVSVVSIRILFALLACLNIILKKWTIFISKFIKVAILYLICVWLSIYYLRRLKDIREVIIQLTYIITVQI